MRDYPDGHGGPTKEKVKQLYDRDIPRSSVLDAWHSYSRSRSEAISRALISRYHGEVDSSILLNLGSGGHSAGLTARRHYHVDIALSSLKGVPTAVTADMERLPFEAGSVDLVVSLGCGLNYCDALRAVHEMARVLRKSGHLIVEFESTSTLEYLFTTVFGASVAPVQVSYKNIPHTIWVYSPDHVREVLAASGLKLLATEFFHILSPLAVRRQFASLKLARKLWRLDPIVGKLSLLNKLACNVIICAERL